jgi:hypothetical protein
VHNQDATKNEERTGTWRRIVHLERNDGVTREADADDTLPAIDT